MTQFTLQRHSRLITMFSGKTKLSMAGVYFIPIRDNIQAQAQNDLDVACEALWVEISKGKGKPIHHWVLLTTTKRVTRT